jgi:hypothetical protein
MLKKRSSSHTLGEKNVILRVCGCEWEMNTILTRTLNKAGLINNAKIILLDRLLKIYPTD